MVSFSYVSKKNTDGSYNTWFNVKVNDLRLLEKKEKVVSVDEDAMDFTY